jgi:flagellar basal-body rod protein FlgG
MRALYTAATGMAAQQLRLDNIANNLANISTVGYKKTSATFEDLIYQDLPTGEANANALRPSSAQVGSGTRLVAMTRNFTPGQMEHSGNTYDLAIGGDGFFVVEDPDGNQRYTRDGQFQSNADGELVNAMGYALSPGIQIPSDAETVTIAQDGTVTVSYSDSTDVATLGQIELTEFANPSGLRALGGNLYSATKESGEPIPMDEGVLIQQGYFEHSNVDVAEELLSMITAQRVFELTSKVIEAADENLQLISKLKR